MDKNGMLSSWNDAKGFGFITPAGGGDRVFAHISAYAGRGRPVANRRVAYDLAADRQGRLRADRFRYVGVAKLGASVGPGVWMAGFVVLMVFGTLVALFDLGYLPVTVPGAYAAVSLMVFGMYWIDKRAAGREAQRIPESRLHLFELLCGWPGALLAQQVLRHKTRKRSFQFVFWLVVLNNLGALAWLVFAPEAQGIRQQLGFG